MHTIPSAPFSAADPLPPGQRAELVIARRDGAGMSVVLATDRRIEAPNWSADGRWLVVNGGGRLYRIAIDGGRAPEVIDTAPLADLNNDHLLSPDGRWHYVSSDDGHIYRLPFAGGPPVRVTNDRGPAETFRHYLHGISPDGARLAYVGLEHRAGRVMTRIWTLPSAGGEDRAETTVRRPVDGPEFSPDGDALWFNAEPDGAPPGHAQIFFKPLAGGPCRQMTHDARVNWFAHPAPDGRRVAYLSYPPGTRGHPADREVIVRMMRPDGSGVKDIDRFIGGQGTINVPSWAPDSSAFAYVRYPREGP